MFICIYSHLLIRALYHVFQRLVRYIKYNNEYNLVAIRGVTPPRRSHTYNRHVELTQLTALIPRQFISQVMSDTSVSESWLDDIRNQLYELLKHTDGYPFDVEV